MLKYPAITLSIVFITSLLFQKIINLELFIYLVFVSLSILFFIIIHCSTSKSSFLKKIFIGSIVFCIGGISLLVNEREHYKYPFNKPKIKNVSIVGTITNIDLINNKKLSFSIKLQKIENENHNEAFPNKFICNIWKDSLILVDTIYDSIQIGNVISFNGTIKKARNIRNPGEFDYEDYLLKKGISGIIDCYKPESFSIINSKISVLSNLVFNIRKEIDSSIRHLYNVKSASLIKGILLADRSEISYEIKNSFINTGVIHVLAVSGLHVGFIALIFILILGRFDIRITYTGTIIGILLFLILTGGHASVFRASVMAIVFLIAKLTGRSTNGYNSISIAALIILIINPNELFNPGFLLSFSAVLSILTIYPIISLGIDKLKINNLPRKILMFMAVSFAAQIGTLPFTLIYFNKLSLVSLFSNLLVIPLIGIIVANGILSLVTATFSLLIASIFASANMIIIDFLFFVIQYVSTLSFAYLPVFNFSLFDGFIFYTFIGVIFFVLVKFKNIIIIIVVVLLSIASILIYSEIDNSDIRNKDKLLVYTIDVGQGDSFLIKFPNNQTALIDAGNATSYFDNGERIILPFIRRLGIDKIDYAFISHLDSDHYGGFISLINNGIIQNVYKPYNQNSIKDSIFEDYLRFNNINWNYYSINSLMIGNCKLYFLNDTSSTTFKNFDSNNKSGIIKLIYGNTSFLFVGDAEKKAEEFLISRYSSFLKSDVLKVGHHGSKTSTSNEFLDIVSPKIGIISAGIANRFNHPSSQVIEKLDNNGTQIRRTDLEGAIIIASDGKNIENITWR